MSISIKIVTYNIQLGGKGREEAILEVLRGTNADIISLTEADDPDIVASLAENLKMYFIWKKGSGDRHIATLSRYPITNSKIYTTPPLTQAVLETTHDINGAWLRIFNIHFLPYLLLPFEARRWQAIGKLLKIIRGENLSRHLIIGDLNAIGPGDRVIHKKNPARMQRVMAFQLFIIFKLAIPRLLNAGYVDCFRKLHPKDAGFTWRTGRRTTRYDYIFADPILAPMLRECYVLDNLPGLEIASDHYPLVANFDIN
ncbi:MAG: endonuclease/exonuclease/phosphatase family protein [Anaerolineae bacterium]|nr:endonuclease/exonuclease/phosphatase family protein [Anaerolineae bacterium]